MAASPCEMPGLRFVGLPVVVFCRSIVIGYIGLVINGAVTFVECVEHELLSHKVSALQRCT